MITEVLYMSSSFWLLGVESRDFCPAEKKRTTVLQNWANSQIMATFFTQKVAIFSENVVILWICSALQAVLSFLAWEKSRDSTPNSQKLEDM